MHTSNTSNCKAVLQDLASNGAHGNTNYNNSFAICGTINLELCTSLPLNYGHLSIQDRQLGPVLAAVERSTVLHHVKYSRV